MDGTPVRVRILTETQVFEAPATVVYSHSHLGMGLNFRDVCQILRMSCKTAAGRKLKVRNR